MMPSDYCAVEERGSAGHGQHLAGHLLIQNQNGCPKAAVDLLQKPAETEYEFLFSYFLEAETVHVQ